ncbi:Protein of unknown function DUF3716 [Penicillium brevicompactum]|uniref:Uncharacterized protein n=1 Tax=Penicillium brevicompactum TaxID=5074 RepID=A0A9W9RDZ6_PENBR|nr:Protein of unknown function DUF3716 [Penicillium brevicompactum]
MPPALPSNIHIAGDDFVAPRPGEWVRFCQWVPWARGKTAGAYRSTTISVLSTAIAHRDLSLRPLSVQTPSIFSKHIGESLEHIEGVLIYLTGAEVDDAPCRFCLEGNGPFPLCVVSVANGTPSICANCRWASHQCTFCNNNRNDEGIMFRERLFQSDEWFNLEATLDALDAAHVSQGTGPTQSPAATRVHQAQLQVIQTARAVRRYVNARRL